MSRLFRVAYRVNRWHSQRSSSNLDMPRFAQDVDLDLAGIGQRLLDGLRDVVRHPRGFAVVHLFGVDDDAYFAASLHGKRLLDARKTAGQSFELLETLDVFFKRFAAGAG